MEDTFILSSGFPYPLLGHLKRMEGIEDISLLTNGKLLTEQYYKSYPKDEIVNSLIQNGCKHGVIQI